jgi:hypothetical protein
MTKDFQTSEEVRALESYYQIVLAKNQTRSREIALIEARRQDAERAAALEHESATVEKRGLRIGGMYAIGAGVGMISILALLLVLLSIQRYLRHIDECLSRKPSTP